MKNLKVALQVCKDYNIDKIKIALEKQFECLGGISNFIKPKQRVLIKADLFCQTEPNIAKTTHPNIISALAEIVDKSGGSCIIADCPKGDFSQSNLDKMYSQTQMLEASNNGHACLNYNDNLHTIYSNDGETARDFNIMDAINDADLIINVGKFRCDKHLGIIGCGQNLLGIIPSNLKKLIKNKCFTLDRYSNYLIDLFDVIKNKVVLNILDGIVSCESNNQPRILNALLMGQNPYAVDSVALQIINQDPEQNSLLQNAYRRKLFDWNFEVNGDIQPLILTDYNYPVLAYGATIKNSSISKLKKEYNKTQRRAIISPKNCKGCKTCVSTCPMSAINMKTGDLGEAYAVIDYDKCINCLKCVNNCPYKIITTKTPLKYKILTKKSSKKIKNRVE